MDRLHAHPGERDPEVPARADPPQALPLGLRPMLASSGAPPSGEAGWAYEMKWDGMRALAYVQGGLVRLRSRNDNDVTVAFPELAALGAALTTRPVLLDGEIVVFDPAGRPSFELLQSRMHVADPHRAVRLAEITPVTYIVFDVLHLDTRPLLARPYRERQAVLDGLGLAGPAWRTFPALTGVPGADVLAASRRQGLEGVVAKRLDAPYRPGLRSDAWRKIKNVRRQELVVGGYKPGEAGRAGQLGSLLLGVYAPAGLTYAGHVGTGFNQATLRLLQARLAPLARDSSPFDTEVPREHARAARWVQPRLVVEVEFTAWTRTGQLRHPSYKGLRDDKEPTEVVREP